MASDFPYTFSLTVRNKVCNLGDKRYTVPASTGQTLLSTLQSYQKTETDFRFQTKDLPTSGLYVDGVMGENKKANQFWATLLYDPNTCDVIPISFNYNVGSADHIYLLYQSI